MTGWASPPSVVFYFAITTTTTLRALDSGTLTFFAKVDTPQWAGNNHLKHQQRSVTSAFATPLAAAINHFTERLIGWQKKNFLTNAGTQSRRWHLLAKQPRTKEWRRRRRRRQCNGCFDKATTALPKSDTSCFKLPCDISQFWETVLLSKPYARKKHLIKQAFLSLAFMPPANKVQKQLKINQLKNTTKHQKWWLENNKISDENTIFIK